MKNLHKLYFISKDELVSDFLLWTPTHGHASIGRPTRTYPQQLYSERDRRERERFLLSARLYDYSVNLQIVARFAVFIKSAQY